MLKLCQYGCAMVIYVRSWPVHPTINIALIIFIPHVIKLILNLILVLSFFNRVHDDERLIEDKL